MLARLIERFTGRRYEVGFGDLGYLWSKGGASFLRGCIWSMLRLRRPRALMLGRQVQFVQSGRLVHGRGVSIGAFSYLDCSARQGISLGDKVTLRERAWLQCRSGLNERAEAISIGDRTYIGPNAVLGAGGPIRIGADVQIGANLAITAESHLAGSDGSFTSGHVQRRGVRIESGCWLGNNVVVLDGVTIGVGAVIGAGSVVTRSIPPRAVAYGNPARVARMLDQA